MVFVPKTHAKNDFRVLEFFYPYLVPTGTNLKIFVSKNVCYGSRKYFFQQVCMPTGIDVQKVVKPQNLELSKINAPPANYQQF